MHKVVVERPRGGRNWARTRPPPKPPFDDSQNYESMMASHTRRKWFSDLLGPLRRWLRSQVGRPWDDVYSEACAVIKPDSVVRAHIKTHLLDYVERDTFMKAGEVWCFCHFSWHGSNELPVHALNGYRHPFFVHPGTGLLCEIPSRRRERWRDKSADELAKVQRWLNDSKLLRHLSGSWFECHMEAFPSRDIRYEGPLKFDLNTHRLLSRDDATRLYGRAVRCIAKRQLSRRELKRHGLVNSPASAQPSPHFPNGALTAARNSARRFINLNPGGRMANAQHIHEDGPFFRDHKQAPERLSVRDAGQARRPRRPRRQGAAREAGAE